MRFTQSSLAAVAIAVAALGAPPAQAATATGLLAVSAIVLSTCVVVATPMLFNNYTLAVLDTTAAITVTCTPDVLSYTVGLDAGQGGGTTSTRKAKVVISTVTNTLNYGLFRDVNHTQNWGNVPGTDTVASTAATVDLGVVKTFTVYGQMASNQAGAIGTYLDTVQVSVNY